MFFFKTKKDDVTYDGVNRQSNASPQILGTRFASPTSSAVDTSARVLGGSLDLGNARYCVIDLAAGPSALNYPVSFIDAPPQGGFNTSEYKLSKLVLRRIEQGTFTMGSCDEESNRPHVVRFTKPFYCGIFEVTQAQFELVMGYNPSEFTGSMRPVEQICWDVIRGNSITYDWPTQTDVDPNSFMGRLMVRTGMKFDLPTESQWEYACRAGTTSNFNNGRDSTRAMKTLGRYDDNRLDGRGGYSEHTTVGSYEPNAWGLYDMHGNVWEWCLDWLGDLEVASNLTDPVGPSSGSNRVLRGGGWGFFAPYCASSFRSGSLSTHEYANSCIGFRLVAPLWKYEGLAAGGMAPVMILRSHR